MMSENEATEAESSFSEPAPTEYIIEPVEQSMRLDLFLVQKLPQFSRAHLRRAIDQGGILLNNKSKPKPSHKLSVGDQLTLLKLEVPRSGPKPEKIPLDILYEDDDMAVVNKPAGMIVHPAKGHWAGTLASALAFHFDQLSTTGGETRPGIVHRLDRDTSGVIVVAKNNRAHEALAAQFKARTVEKEYLAILTGAMSRDRDMIDRPIGPHPKVREKMAIRSEPNVGREAQTFFEVQERFPGFLHVIAKPKTGRTHQIRVHIASVRNPVLCDKIYGGRSYVTATEIYRILNAKPPQSLTAVDGTETPLLARQALHASRIKICQPTTGKLLEFQAEIPTDIQSVLDLLRELQAKH